MPFKTASPEPAIATKYDEEYHRPIRRHTPEQILRKLEYHKRLYEFFLKEAQDWLVRVEDIREEVYNAVNKK